MPEIIGESSCCRRGNIELFADLCNFASIQIYPRADGGELWIIKKTSYKGAPERTIWFQFKIKKFQMLFFRKDSGQLHLAIYDLSLAHPLWD